MKKLLLTYIMITLLCVLLLGCDNEKEDEQVTGKDNEFYTVQSSDGKVESVFDIDRDGSSEILDIDFCDTQNDEQVPVSIDIIKDGISIWYSEVGLPHAGWGSYYIVVYENDTYLFYYVPEESQGQEVCYYKLFWIDSDGNEVVADESSVDSSASDNFEEMKEEFNKKVTKYLESSTLLISTLEGELVYYQN